MEQPIYYTANIEANQRKLQRVRDIACLALGTGAGILTLESYYGFGFYIVGITVVNAAFWTVCCEGRSHRYFTNPAHEIFLKGVVTDIPGFVMMWCLVYALVKSNS